MYRGCRCLVVAAIDVLVSVVEFGDVAEAGGMGVPICSAAHSAKKQATLLTYDEAVCDVYSHQRSACLVEDSLCSAVTVSVPPLPIATCIRVWNANQHFLSSESSRSKALKAELDIYVAVY